MSKLILVPFTVILASCYFFPFVPAALPFANSKMLMAAVGLTIFIVGLSKKQNAGLDRDFLTLTILALLVSLMAFLSMTLNHTPDNTFMLYVISVWVWLGGAYALISIIKGVHGGVSVPLVVNYLLAVCVAQCVLALVFDNSPAASDWCERVFSGEAYMGNTSEDRLHGIGCSLDVAGFKFAAVICMGAIVLMRGGDRTPVGIQLLYIAAICVITVIGNMISRSTVIGAAIAFAYIILRGMFTHGNRRVLGILAVSVTIVAAICVSLYNSDEAFRENIRFGFEGFFSMTETGDWSTNSNNILRNMVVWPDNAKTWLIGDGYINNPTDKTLSTFDPYYVGPTFGGYYQGTDIGYLRYIFYFGIFGLLAISLVFLESCRMLCRRFPAFKWIFIMVVALNFIEWFKVSSDMFAVLAPFFCFTTHEKRACYRR